MNRWIAILAPIFLASCSAHEFIDDSCPVTTGVYVDLFGEVESCDAQYLNDEESFSCLNSAMFRTPVPTEESQYWHGNSTLSVRLNTDGSWSDRSTWWFIGEFNGNPKAKADRLSVVARRMNGTSAVPNIDYLGLYYTEPSGAFVVDVDIKFPSLGCWEVEGRLDDQAVSFVTNVIRR